LVELTATAYRTNTSRDPFFSLPLRIVGSDSLEFGDQTAILVETLNSYKSASGRYENYFYHLVVSSATKFVLQLIDDATSEFDVIRFVKDDVDRKSVV
jgi:hypothetical protein